MSFFDKAKQAATELAAKADGALANAGLNPGGASSGGREADRLLRDLGVLTYREANGQADVGDAKQRVLMSLRALESAGQLGMLTTSDQAPPPPGAAGATFAPPPPPGAAATFTQQAPPAASTPVPSQSAPIETQSGGGTVAPPPPPSWASTN
jgi:hypothetical protein